MNRAGLVTRADVEQWLPLPPFSGYTADELGGLVGRSESWVREILRQMVRDGRVERITQGPGHPVYYRLKGAT